jgi:hypothetical protein
MTAVLTPREALEQLVDLRARKIRLRDHGEPPSDELAAKLDRAWKVAEKALQQPSAPLLPEGWKAVPIKYTYDQMIVAYQYAKRGRPRASERDIKAAAFDLTSGYREMVAAAPPLPPEHG